jgi:hypothetical protein
VKTPGYPGVFFTLRLTSAEHPLRLVYDAYQYFWYRDGVFHARFLFFFLFLLCTLG